MRHTHDSSAEIKAIGIHVQQNDLRTCQFDESRTDNPIGPTPIIKQVSSGFGAARQTACRPMAKVEPRRRLLEIEFAQTSPAITRAGNTNSGRVAIDMHAKDLQSLATI